MEANAALRTIVRRDNGESYREMLTRMAKESGIDRRFAGQRVVYVGADHVRLGNALDIFRAWRSTRARTQGPRLKLGA